MELLPMRPSSSFLSKTCPKHPLCIRSPLSSQTQCSGLPRKHFLPTRIVRTYSVRHKQCTAIPIAEVTSLATILCMLEEGYAYAADSVSDDKVMTAFQQPQWLAPAVLAFPVVSYLIFNIYRDKVNPAAKVSDWMFGLAAMVIVANIVAIVTFGVRLY